MTTKSTHTDSEQEVTREASNSEESMDNDNDEPEPENDDEPSSDESSDDETTVCLEPHQPKKSKFPTILSSGQYQSFQSSWYSKWLWLEWNDEMECAFCHPCRMAISLNFITHSKKS